MCAVKLQYILIRSDTSYIGIRARYAFGMLKLKKATKIRPLPCDKWSNAKNSSANTNGSEKTCASPLRGCYAKQRPPFERNSLNNLKSQLHNSSAVDMR